MNKEEILKMSREENEGRHDECEMMAYGTASRVGMLVGAIICAVLVFASELLFHIPEIGLVGWLVYFAMQGSGSIVLYKKLKNRCCFANKLRKIFIQSAKKKRRLKGF